MRIFLASLVLLFISCNTSKKSQTAQEIVDAAMLASGSEKVAKATISFKFRDIQYKAIRNQGRFLLERSFKENKDSITDQLSNEGFTRLLNNQAIQLHDTLATAYSGSVNSVHYFSVLPFGLNDMAVRKKRLADQVVFGKDYYTIQIRFSEEGGGEDFDDVYIYWINKETSLIDYLAYSFHVNGGGVRFREATNPRTIKGVRFVDYNNYKKENALTDLENLAKAFEKGELQKLSEINLEAISVQITP
ncbi:hypothetical protein GCM10011416_15400 [Polaribacter pacificus]|uniref:Deoxyribose-phosphate aldolase n=1 Tax=Polaribacter pacificus TaxID=1775173 RepID=A0A917HZF5_9FLAO|nr:DUF6503 family protein [Polaribacter pacificus]GGG98234.1 hypothetical protein GCM10011416_15400 [Polaribacter pacificus]